MIKKILLALTLVGIISFAGTIFYLHREINLPYHGPDTTFEVENGDTFGKVNYRLHAQKLIHNPRLFHYLARYQNALNRFRAGSYTIKQGSTMEDVLFTLVHGQPNLSTLTIPEGKNIYEIASLLETSGITSAKDFLAVIQSAEFLSEMQIEGSSAEGYLFPDTYRFAPNTPAKNVAKGMIELFHKKTKEVNFTHPFLSKHQVVILASMVEKETGAKSERPAIAGVFTNRLKKKMRLESDPTTIYGIWSRYTGNIRKSDLQEVTPYNTYKIPALPIGPIANPSLEAIQAVLNPEQHDYFFFVSRNDGTHVFTKNYGDHVEAVENFQKNVSARRGKSWRDLKQ